MKNGSFGNPAAVPGQDSYQQKIETVLQDLTVLKKAGFTGLVTYGSREESVFQAATVAGGFVFLLWFWGEIAAS